MSITQGQALLQVRQALDEASSRRWTDPHLCALLNEGQRAIARASAWYRKNDDVEAEAETQEYDLPADAIKLYSVCYIMDDSAVRYDLDILQKRNITSVSSQYAITQGIPRLAWTGGYPGTDTFKLNVVPIPAVAGTFNIDYYGIPDDLATDGTAEDTGLTIPLGFEAAIVHFAIFNALMSDRDPRWQEYRALYQEEMGQLTELSETGVPFTDQVGSLGGERMPTLNSPFDEEW